MAIYSKYELFHALITTGLYDYKRKGEKKESYNSLKTFNNFLKNVQGAIGLIQESRSRYHYYSEY